MSFYSEESRFEQITAVALLQGNAKGNAARLAG